VSDEIAIASTIVFWLSTVITLPLVLSKNENNSSQLGFEKKSFLNSFYYKIYCVKITKTFGMLN